MHICLANDTLRSNQTRAAYAHLLIPSHLSVNLLGILILLPPIFIPNITIFHHLYYFTPNPRHPHLPPRLGHGSPLVFLPHSPSWPQPAFTLHRALVTKCINQIPTPAVKPSRGSQTHSDSTRDHDLCDLALHLSPFSPCAAACMPTSLWPLLDCPKARSQFGAFVLAALPAVNVLCPDLCRTVLFAP